MIPEPAAGGTLTVPFWQRPLSSGGVMSDQVIGQPDVQ